jgi:hypothetical protein
MGDENRIRVMKVLFIVAIIIIATIAIPRILDIESPIINIVSASEVDDHATINITFAGNRSYYGRPDYEPPAMSPWSAPCEGYFVNGSYINATEMEIWCNINDGDGIGDGPFVCWWDMTNGSRYNGTKITSQGGVNYTATMNGFDTFYTSGSWQSPTSGYSHKNSKGADYWSSFSNAYDDNTGTKTTAGTTGSGELMFMNISSTNCDKVRIWCNNDGGVGADKALTYDLDVYYNGRWNDVFDGTQSNHSTWYTHSLGTTDYVTSARISATIPVGENAQIFEFDFWESTEEIVSAPIPPFAPKHRYSFNIMYNDSGGEPLHYVEPWYKNETKDHPTLIRRSVYLNCNESNSNLEYPTAWYTMNVSAADYPKTADEATQFGGTVPEGLVRHDLWLQDQAVLTNTDTGKLSRTEPTNDTQFTFCSAYFASPLQYDGDEVGFAINKTTLTNCYIRTWWSNQTVALGNNSYCDFGIARREYGKLGSRVYWNEKRFYSADKRAILDVKEANQNEWTWVNDCVEYVQLATMYLTLPNIVIDSNSMYNVTFFADVTNVNNFCNRSYRSFIFFNLPDNETMNSTDWSSIGGGEGDYDGDGLLDWDELFVHYTSPLHEDTDEDGTSDYIEIEDENDPNVYTDYSLYTPWIQYHLPLNGTVVGTSHVCNMTVVHNNSELSDIGFQSNFSDGSTWVTYNISHSVASWESVYWVFDEAIEPNKKYFWKVYAAEGIRNVSRWYYFYTADWYNEKADFWCVKNEDGRRIFNLTRDGNISIAGTFYPCSSRPDADGIYYSFNDSFWLTVDGDLYISENVTWVTRPMWAIMNYTKRDILRFSNGNLWIPGYVIGGI